MPTKLGYALQIVSIEKDVRKTKNSVYGYTDK